MGGSGCPSVPRSAPNSMKGLMRILVLGLLLGAGSLAAQDSTRTDTVPGTATRITTRIYSTRLDTVFVTKPDTVKPPVVADTVFAQGFEGAAPKWGDESGSHPIVSGGHTGKALQVTYPAGSEGGWFTQFFGPGYDSLYVRVWINLAPGWSGGTKLFSFYGGRTDNLWAAAGKSGVCPTGTDFFVATLTADPTPPMNMRFYSQYAGMPGNAGTCYGSNGPLTNYTPQNYSLSVGVWHKLEFWVRLNRLGRTDGLQQFAVDDTLRGKWTGIQWRKDAALTLNSWTFSASSPGNAVSKSLLVDDILVSKRNLMGAVPPVVVPPVDTPPPVTPPSGPYAPPSIINWTFEDGKSPATPFGSAIPVVKGDAATTDGQYSAYSNWPSGSGSEVSPGWIFYGANVNARPLTDVWSRWAVKFYNAYTGSGATGQKVNRIYDEGGNKYISSLGRVHDGFIYDFGNTAFQPHLNNIPAPGSAGFAYGTWHWFELHFWRSGSHWMVDIYFDGEAKPRHSFTDPATSSGSFGGYYEIFTTLNGPFNGPYGFKVDDVAYSVSRIGLPKTAKIGVP